MDTSQPFSFSFLEVKNSFAPSSLCFSSTLPSSSFLYFSSFGFGSIFRLIRFLLIEKTRAGQGRAGQGMKMGMSKTQINLRRLLAAAPQQQNPSKLIHYVATLRELLEKLAEERTPDGLPRVSKAVINDYSEKIENIASELSAKLPTVKVSQEPATTSNSFKQSPQSDVENHAPSSPGLRRRVVPTSSFKDETRDNAEAGTSDPVKLDAAAQMHIEKHRKLQEDLTDEMVGLARQLKESSLMMSQSLENTEKLLDSTEKAVEDSLSRTGHANDRAMKIYSETSKTTCFQWLLIFFMTCIFIMVVLLIRVT